MNMNAELAQMASGPTTSVNVLSLDGGGVRGLSTLIVLHMLLCLVNKKLNPTTHNNKPIQPTKVFDLIVGTSTGGLIALMLVKLHMDVEECIKQYKTLSCQIFRRKWYKPWHYFGKFSGGLGLATKFCSSKLRKILLEHVIQPALLNGRCTSFDADANKYTMENTDSHHNVMCSVVCNELYAKTHRRAEEPVFICSHWNSLDPKDHVKCGPWCRSGKKEEEVAVIDAARATSAAPTYFKPVRLLGRLLVDGGYGETNNPSEAAYEHYFWEGLKPKSQYENIRMVNIGTGTHPKHPVDWQPEASLLDYIPLARIIGDLAKLATESEKVGKRMTMQAESARGGVGPLKFARFSANCGDIHEIDLGDWRALDHIEACTYEYLRNPEVLQQLEEFAEQLADTCRTRAQQDVPLMEPEIVISTVTKQQQGRPRITPRISLTAPATSGRHETNLDDNASVTGNLPPLTDESGRLSSDAPLTPIDDQRSLRGKQSEVLRSPDHGLLLGISADGGSFQNDQLI